MDDIDKNEVCDVFDDIACIILKDSLLQSSSENGEMLNRIANNILYENNIVREKLRYSASTSQTEISAFLSVEKITNVLLGVDPKNDSARGKVSSSTKIRFEDERSTDGGYLKYLLTNSDDSDSGSSIETEISTSRKPVQPRPLEINIGHRDTKRDFPKEDIPNFIEDYRNGKVYPSVVNDSSSFSSIYLGELNGFDSENSFCKNGQKLMLRRDRTHYPSKAYTAFDSYQTSKENIAPYGLTHQFGVKKGYTMPYSCMASGALPPYPINILANGPAPLFQPISSFENEDLRRNVHSFSGNNLIPRDTMPQRIAEPLQGNMNQVYWTDTGNFLDGMKSISSENLGVPTVIQPVNINHEFKYKTDVKQERIYTIL